METYDQRIRIQKFIADQGICSRRAAEGHIRNGNVVVNGQLAQLGDKIEPGKDFISLEGKRITYRAPAKLTIALNKPKGFICSNDDPHNDRTVFDLLPKEFANQRLFCAGRLDKDSEGLVILTNDGDLANKLMHPSSLVTKIYSVELKQLFPKEKIPKLLNGINYEGERLKVEQAVFLGNRNRPESKDLDVAMHHGKKREIRRLFSVLGFDVKRLKRYQIGRYNIKGIPKGAGLPLAPNDIEKLFQQPIEAL
ncbi:rRNA pseudouridine synthase [Puniceicoccaceae bacterium K14]|nr:rRNA pseudouridine synthase [Puniceicoccaceae bacterium K14]